MNEQKRRARKKPELKASTEEGEKLRVAAKAEFENWLDDHFTAYEEAALDALREGNEAAKK